MPQLVDGFNTLISIGGQFGAPNTVSLVEVEVTPPEMNGGGEINITGMRNVVWRTKAPKYLITLGNMMCKAKYDPIAYRAGAVRSNINVNQAVILTFPVLAFALNPIPLGLTETFYGWLNKFAPENMKEGDLPLADIEIIPSMQQSGDELPLVST